MVVLRHLTWMWGVAVALAWGDAAAEMIDRVKDAMRQATRYYYGQVASHGGYVYFYSLDLQDRWGEGTASKDQIWVQPPGTPTVGLAYLAAYDATGERLYLEAATAAAEAIVYGQLVSGGWTNCVDFNPRGDRVYRYRNGRGRGRNVSSLDDGQTQSAIRLLVHADRALDFRRRPIHEAARIALDALLTAQFPNGGFPQVWDDDAVPDPPIRKADYPDYDWRTEGRIKNYWDMYTLNDNVAGYVAHTLIDACRIYGEERYAESLRKLGDFLILAQMPASQPGWAQQYNYEMHPIWARTFEPPAVAGDETQEALQTLMDIHQATGDPKYLAPIPSALAWLKASRLPDGRLARYYELKINRPLYMVRRGKTYTLTYDDSRLPKHYGWKIESRIGDIERRYVAVVAGDNGARTEPVISIGQLREILAALDEEGRWISVYQGERLVGQPKIPRGDRYLSSERFSRNLTALSAFVRRQTQTEPGD